MTRVGFDLRHRSVRIPNLAKVLVDEGAEAAAVLPWARAHGRLSLLVDGFVATGESNMALWSALVGRLNARTLSIPRHERLISELRGLRREEFAFGSKWRVVDGSRRYHRDVSVSLAGAVMAAGEVDAEPPLMLYGGSTYREWEARHGVRPCDDEPTREEREQVWPLVEQFGLAVETNDASAAEQAWTAIEAHVAAVEASDAAAGRRLRPLVAQVERLVEERTHASA